MEGETPGEPGMGWNIAIKNKKIPRLLLREERRSRCAEPSGHPRKKFNTLFPQRRLFLHFCG